MSRFPGYGFVCANVQWSRTVCKTLPSIGLSDAGGYPTPLRGRSAAQIWHEGGSYQTQSTKSQICFRSVFPLAAAPITAADCGGLVKHLVGRYPPLCESDPPGNRTTPAGFPPAHDLPPHQRQNNSTGGQITS